MSPVVIDMLSEELPQVLQSLLIGIERIIGGHSSGDSSSPPSKETPTSGVAVATPSLCVANTTTNTTAADAVVVAAAATTVAVAAKDDADDNQQKCSSTPKIRIGSPKCGLKRRELITKSTKLLNNKYLMKRMSSSASPFVEKTESGNGDGGGGVSDVGKDVTTPSTEQQTLQSFANITTMSLYCMGGSFPHIDSDEEGVDDICHSTITTTATTTGTVSTMAGQQHNQNDQQEHRYHHHDHRSSNHHQQQQQQQHQQHRRCSDDLVTPKSIKDLPEKLLMSGIYLPGTADTEDTTFITIEAWQLIKSGVNSFEVATLLLYYSTIPISPVTFTLHLIMNESCHLSILDLLDKSLKILEGHVRFDEVIIFGALSSQPVQQLPASGVKAVYLASGSSKLLNSVMSSMIACDSGHKHDQTSWRDFFVSLEPLQRQCVAVGKRLVTVMGDIRDLDLQGLPSRRQLHSQHRALCRALHDPDLQNLRRKGNASAEATLSKLRDYTVTRLYGKSCCMADNRRRRDHLIDRLDEVVLIFNEVDRTVQRLEQLSEHRQQRLLELTHQKMLEDEINEVISWIRGDGEQTLLKFTDTPLESGDRLKVVAQEFEKYYFISMKHLAKGRDLHDTAVEMESLKESARILKQYLGTFSERLAVAHERIEGCSRTRLNNLPSLNQVQQLQQKQQQQQQSTTAIMSKEVTETAIPSQAIRTKLKEKPPFRSGMSFWNGDDELMRIPPTILPPLLEENIVESGGSTNGAEFSQYSGLDEDEEDHSKMADSGLGGCDRCECDSKLERTCSCHSFEDGVNGFAKSCGDDFEEEISQLDMSTPFLPNSHLHCYNSNLHLPEIDETSGIDQKTQKTILLIMREMIGTERDYVRSLHYIIENYMKELLREDIPQALRGQRNVIFGNVERIFDFHHQYFLDELERFEKNPLKVGASFLRHESKFYLYALYNKNKPKSDSLMSEYGSVFFKSKQIELADKMDLASYLLKPVQRMGKYALLLQQLMKACASIQGIVSQELSEDLDELQRAEEMVRFQLRHGNDLLAMDSLRECDVNVKEQGRLLRQSEFLVCQGRGGKKTLRQVFLFEELVLFSKARRFPDRKNLDIYIYKNSIKTSDIGLTAHIANSPTKFEIWFRKRKPDDTWTLQSMSEDIKKSWTDEVSRLLWKQAKRNREMRLLEMTSMGIGSKPCLDIRPSQNQINDRSISISQLGKGGPTSLRHSFSGTVSEMKACRRPNSVTSVSSSRSSGTSNSSISASTASSESSVHSVAVSKSTDPNEIASAKHHRSTTLVSQCSIESGIIADISYDESTVEFLSGWPESREPELTINDVNGVNDEEKCANSSAPF